VLGTAFWRGLRRARFGPPVVVVSGLPRSGTSMMMQMLAAGGIEPMTDGARMADESNPRGYYELERVKDLEGAADLRWLRGARGRAVKVIAYLLPHLPETLNYRVVLMQRPLDEVLASQSRMLGALSEAGDGNGLRLRRSYIDHLARTRSLLAHRSCFEALYVDYHAVVRDGAREAARVSQFLGRRLDLVAMAAAVDPALHRQRV
jgi:hypothetical protein